MRILDWIRSKTIFTPEKVEEKPSIALDSQPIHINPTRQRQAARDAARLGRLLTAIRAGGAPGQALMTEIELLQARITVAGYPPPMTPASAAELSKHLGG